MVGSQMEVNNTVRASFILSWRFVVRAFLMYAFCRKPPDRVFA